MCLHGTPFLLCNDLLCPLMPHVATVARYVCVATSIRARRSLQLASCCDLGRSILVSEQANDGGAHAFGARLLNYADNAALPVDVHDFSDATNRYLLVDKTMFIADILDSEAPVAFCCRPKGFGKSMNLSMLKCYLERPDHRLPDRSLFAGTQIWQAGGGRYRDEYASYPVIMLDFTVAAARRDADAAAAIRSAVANECARLLPLLAAPDLSRREVRLIERAARGVASDKEIDAALGVLIKLLQAAFDEQVVLLIDDYDAVCPKRLDAKDDGSVDSLESLSRMLFDTIADAGDSLRLTCLMCERPGHAEFALSQRGVSYRSATALSSWCDRWFGFSDDEVQVLLDCIGRNGCLDDAREWLEGYLFGGFYCSSPERVVDYAHRDCVAPVRADLYCYADRLGACVGDWNLIRLSTLFDLVEPHGFIEAPVHMHAEEVDAAKPEDIWTALYLSGFLTTDMTGHSEDGACLRSLRLPSNEVRQALRLVILEWFEYAVEDVGVIDSFHDGLCRGDEDTVKQALSCAIGDLGIDVGQSDMPTAYHLALQGLCFGLPGYCNPSSKRSGVSDRWDIQVIPTGRVFDVADTLGMLDERPLITINMLYDPGVDALGLELLAVQALLDIERDGIDDIRAPRPAVGRMRWGFGFDGQRVSVVCQRL